ncbi:MAG: cell division protein FtsA [Muribaculaceae bacterium]|nr:cell division protein FtsA [Muribaculaceae bacterium]
MKQDTSYVASIEIGSSKITGAVGVYSSERHSLEVLAIEQEESKDAVRYGIIQNPEEVAARVSRIVARLNESQAVAPGEVMGFYVGLSGRSMHSIPSEVQLHFPEETEITGEMLNRLKEDATTIDIGSNAEILATLPRSFQIDGLETTSPKGAIGKSIIATYDIIVGRTELRRNLLRALTERCGLQVKGVGVTSLAAANVVLSDEEKRLGCMLVDFGAETTSVSIYRKGALWYFATLPLGGRNITRDLTSLSILEERAEEIKCESGRAIPRETPSTLNFNGIKLSDVSNLVVARAEELVANVIQQISYAGLKEKDLPAGIVCIGGASNLNGLLELIENMSEMTARRGALRADIRTIDQRAKRIDTIQVAALLYQAALAGVTGCLQTPLPETEEPAVPEDTTETEGKEEPAPARTGIFTRLGSRITNWFNSPSEDESELE